MEIKYYYQRDMTWNPSDKNYNKKKNSLMNDDSVNKLEIALTKETCGLYPIHDFHKNFNKSLNTTAYLSPTVSMHVSMATTHSTTLQ